MRRSIRWFAPTAKSVFVLKKPGDVDASPVQPVHCSSSSERNTIPSAAASNAFSFSLVAPLSSSSVSPASSAPSWQHALISFGSALSLLKQEQLRRVNDMKRRPQQQQHHHHENTGGESRCISEVGDKFAELLLSFSMSSSSYHQQCDDLPRLLRLVETARSAAFVLLRESALFVPSIPPTALSATTIGRTLPSVAASASACIDRVCSAAISLHSRSSAEAHNLFSNAALGGGGKFRVAEMAVAQEDEKKSEEKNAITRNGSDDALLYAAKVAGEALPVMRLQQRDAGSSVSPSRTHRVALQLLTSAIIHATATTATTGACDSISSARGDAELQFALQMTTLAMSSSSSPTLPFPFASDQPENDNDDDGVFSNLSAQRFAAAILLGVGPHLLCNYYLTKLAGEFAHRDPSCQHDRHHLGKVLSATYSLAARQLEQLEERKETRRVSGGRMTIIGEGLESQQQQQVAESRQQSPGPVFAEVLPSSAFGALLPTSPTPEQRDEFLLSPILCRLANLRLLEFTLHLLLGSGGGGGDDYDQAAQSSRSTKGRVSLVISDSRCKEALVKQMLLCLLQQIEVTVVTAPHSAARTRSKNNKGPHLAKEDEDQDDAAAEQALLARVMRVLFLENRDASLQRALLSCFGNTSNNNSNDSKRSLTSLFLLMCNVSPLSKAISAATAPTNNTPTLWFAPDDDDERKQVAVQLQLILLSSISCSDQQQQQLQHQRSILQPLLLSRLISPSAPPSAASTTSFIDLWRRFCSLLTQEQDQRQQPLCQLWCDSHRDQDQVSKNSSDFELRQLISFPFSSELLILVRCSIHLNIGQAVYDALLHGEKCSSDKKEQELAEARRLFLNLANMRIRKEESGAAAAAADNDVLQQQQQQQNSTVPPRVSQIEVFLRLLWREGAATQKRYAMQKQQLMRHLGRFSAKIVAKNNNTEIKHRNESSRRGGDVFRDFSSFFNFLTHPDPTGNGLLHQGLDGQGECFSSSIVHRFLYILFRDLMIAMQPSNELFIEMARQTATTASSSSSSSSAPGRQEKPLSQLCLARCSACLRQKLTHEQPTQLDVFLSDRRAFSATWRRSALAPAVFLAASLSTSTTSDNNNSNNSRSLLVYSLFRTDNFFSLNVSNKFEAILLVAMWSLDVFLTECNRRGEVKNATTCWCSLVRFAAILEDALHHDTDHEYRRQQRYRSLVSTAARKLQAMYASDDKKNDDVILVTIAELNTLI